MSTISSNSKSINYFESACFRVRNTLGSVFSTFTAIKNDGNATVQLLKVSRYAIFALKTHYGKFSGSSLMRQDLKAAINLLEGLQFIAVISSLIPIKKEDNEESEPKAPLLERISDGGFKVSDCFSGALWLLSKGIPVLGPLSESAKIIKSLDIASMGSALIASIADGGSATQIITKHWKISSTDKTSALWQLAERITGIVSLILILAEILFLAEVGGTLATIATGLAAASAFFGLMRFAYNNTEKRGETWESQSFATE